MLVWLSWNVIVSDDQTGEPESFPSFTMVSISGAFAQDGLLPAALVPSSRTFVGFATRVSWAHQRCYTRCAEVRALSTWLRWPPQSFYAATLCPVWNNTKRKQRGRSSWCKLRRCCHGKLVRAISALQHHRGRWWKWATVISSRWNHANHVNSLKLQAHLASLRWRTRTPQCVAVRSFHVLDSQVALSILTKGPSSSLRFCRVVNKCNAPCLTASYTTLLGYSRTAEHPADRASRAHGDVGEMHNQSAGQSRGDISVHFWDDYEATAKIEAINYVSSVLYYLPQLKDKVPGSTRLLMTWDKCELSTRAPPLSTFSLAALAGKAVALHD